jgi:thiol-disulfide isomerase/thioredoxin
MMGCQQNQKSPLDRLENVIQNIEAMSSYEYSAYYDIYQEGQRMTDTTLVYIQKSTEEGLLPVNYVFESKAGDFQFFDGRKMQNLMAEERLIIHTENPPSSQVVSHQGLLFSPYYIKIFVRYLLENDRDKIRFIDVTPEQNKSTDFYEIHTDYLYLLNGDVVRNGELLPNEMTAENIQKKYIIGINTETGLPVSIKDMLNEKDYFEVSFSPIQRSDKTFEERSEILQNEKLLSVSMEDYMRIQMARQTDLVGTKAKDFSLPQFPENEVKLSDYAGKPLMLEFWFPGCGFCMDAVPFVNKIAQDFESQGLVVLGIDMSNASPERIKNYMARHNVNIPVLMNGKEMSLEYGVTGGPTFILLNKDHIVTYSASGLNEQELTFELQKVL